MAENTFIIKIITPDRVFYTGEASMVEFNTTEGQIGVYKNHVPMTVIVKSGVLTITGDDVKIIMCIYMIVQIVILIGVFYPVEKALRKHFDKEGNRI